MFLKKIKTVGCDYNPPSLYESLPPSVLLWDMYVKNIKKPPETTQITNIINTPFPEDDY